MSKKVKEAEFDRQVPSVSYVPGPGAQEGSQGSRGGLAMTRVGLAGKYQQYRLTPVSRPWVHTALSLSASLSSLTAIDDHPAPRPSKAVGLKI